MKSHMESLYLGLSFVSQWQRFATCCKRVLSYFLMSISAAIAGLLGDAPVETDCTVRPRESCSYLSCEKRASFETRKEIKGKWEHWTEHV